VNRRAGEKGAATCGGLFLRFGIRKKEGKIFAQKWDFVAFRFDDGVDDCLRRNAGRARS
jgi:hypothetical protein